MKHDKKRQYDNHNDKFCGLHKVQMKYNKKTIWKYLISHQVQQDKNLTLFLTAYFFVAPSLNWRGLVSSFKTLEMMDAQN